MPNTRSLEYHMANAPLKLARAMVMQGKRIPVTVQAHLEALGMDVGALEQRLIEQQRQQEV